MHREVVVRVVQDSPHWLLPIVQLKARMTNTSSGIRSKWFMGK
jgi:hypothetical protein